MEIKKYEDTQNELELICKEAEGLTLVQNVGAAFKAVLIVKNLRGILSDDLMKDVFIPLMNTNIGFMTDRKGESSSRPVYTIDVVKDAIIDAIAFGLLPTFNQMNILCGKMYPTKEGFTALLKKIKCKYVLNFGQDTTNANSKFAEISVKINYEYRGEKNSFLLNTVVPKHSTSGYDQLKGKAERRAKKMLYEYLTGLDLGESDGDSVQGDEPKIQEAEVINQNEGSPEIKKVEV